MKHLILLIVLFCSIPAYPQQTEAKSLLLSVNGVALGTSHKSVLKKLGKPASDVIGEINECNDSRSREMSYPGLRLTLYEEKTGSGIFYVGEFEVTSRRWNVSGVKIGANTSTIAKRFGKALSDETERGTAERTWFYEIPERVGPGMINFDFRKGRLVRVYAGYTLC